MTTTSFQLIKELCNNINLPSGWSSDIILKKIIIFYKFKVRKDSVKCIEKQIVFTKGKLTIKQNIL